MSKGLQRSRDRINEKVVQSITIPIKSLVLSAAVGVPGWATAVIRGLPKGNIEIFEAFANLQFSSLIAGVANANVPATFTGNFALGTAASTSATLTGTVGNIVPSTAMATAVGSVSAITPSAGSALNLIVNNSDSVSGTTAKLVPTGVSATSVTVKTGPAIAVNLSISVANVSTAAAPITVDGSITLTYAVTGNY